MKNTLIFSLFASALLGMGSCKKDDNSDANSENLKKQEKLEQWLISHSWDGYSGDVNSGVQISNAGIARFLPDGKGSYSGEKTIHYLSAPAEHEWAYHSFVDMRFSYKINKTVDTLIIKGAGFDDSYPLTNQQPTVIENPGSYRGGVLRKR